MAEFPDIPVGFGVPLVDLATDLLPEPTMDALGARFVEDRDRPISLLSNPGVDPTGAADSRAAIQAVIDSAGARPVVVPYGEYKIGGAGLLLPENFTMYGEQGSNAPNPGAVVFTFTGNDGAHAISMAGGGVSGKSRVHLSGFRLIDERVGATTGDGINLQFVYNDVNLHDLFVSGFPVDNIVIGAPSGGSSDCITVENVWTMGCGRYGLNISRVDNYVSIRAVRGDSYTAQGGSMDALISLDITTGDAAVVDISACKLETDTGTHLLRIGPNFFGGVNANALVMRGATAAAGGEVIRVESSSTQTNIFATALSSTVHGGGSPVATSLVNETVAARTWGAGLNRMNMYSRNQALSQGIIAGRYFYDAGMSISGGTGTPEGNVTASPGSFYFRNNGGVGQVFFKATGTGNSGWFILSWPQVRTTTEIQTASNTINTVNKTTGSMVFNSTTGKPVWSTGSSSTSAWKDATGATVHTPA